VYIAIPENDNIEPTLYTLARIKTVLDGVDGVSPKTIGELRDLSEHAPAIVPRAESVRNPELATFTRTGSPLCC